MVYIFLDVFETIIRNEKIRVIARINRLKIEICEKPNRIRRKEWDII